MQKNEKYQHFLYYVAKSILFLKVFALQYKNFLF